VKIWRFENSKQGIEVGVRASERGLDMISLFTKAWAWYDFFVYECYAKYHTQRETIKSFALFCFVVVV